MISKTLRFSPRAASAAFIFVSASAALVGGLQSGLGPPWYTYALLAPTWAILPFIIPSGPEGLIATIHFSSVTWAAIAGLVWPFVRPSQFCMPPISVPRTVRTHQFLGVLAVLHAVIILLATHFANPSGIIYSLWFGFGVLWLLWPVVLISHAGSSLFRVAAPLIVGAALFFYPLRPKSDPGEFAFDGSPFGFFSYSQAYQNGHEEAQREIKSGHLFVEEFGFGRFAPGAPVFSQAALEKYQIKIRRVGDCVVNDRIIGHAKGNNVALVTELERRFGHEMIVAANTPQESP